jgi:hypothetical protein
MFAKIVSISDDGATVQVQLLNSQVKESVQGKQIKFLARAYTSTMEDLDQTLFPEELSRIVCKDHSRKIVLVQTIYAMQDSLSDTHGPSVHRLCAIVPSADSFELFPVVFNKQQVHRNQLKALPAEDDTEKTELEAMGYLTDEISKSALKHAHSV